MYRSADTSGTDRWRSVVQTFLLFVGTLVGAIGIISATASLIMGFGLEEPYALRVAVLSSGTLLLAVLFGLFVRRGTATHSCTLAGCGMASASVGLALFWTTVPAGWTGTLAGLSPVAGGAYVTGLLAVFGAVATSPPRNASENAEQESSGLGGFDSIVTGDERP